MLTNERLKEIADEPHNFSHINYNEVQSMARELLVIREAGDEEVVRLAEEYQLGETEFHRIQTYKNLEGLAIARGQTRTDAVNKAAEWAKECEGLQEQLREAQEDLAWQKKKVRNLQMAADSAGRVDLLSQITTLTAERDEARAELAALKSAPSMAEVDAMGRSAMETLAQIVRDRPETNRPAIDTVPAGRYAKLRDLIDAMLATCRRSIAAREEVVWLLKWLFRNQDLQNCLEWAILSEESRCIIEIVEGK